MQVEPWVDGWRGTGHGARAERRWGSTADPQGNVSQQESSIATQNHSERRSKTCWRTQQKMQLAGHKPERGGSSDLTVGRGVYVQIARRRDCLLPWTVGVWYSSMQGLVGPPHLPSPHRCQGCSSDSLSHVLQGQYYVKGNRPYLPVGNRPSTVASVILF